MYLVTDPALVPGIASLGPDPLSPEFTPQVLAGILAGRRTQIKGVLRDQKIIAGIGNAYSDEVLHAARMSPFRLAASLSGEEVAALHTVIVATLTDAISRSEGLAASDLKAEKKAGLRGARPGRAAVPGLRRHGPRGVLRRFGPAVLPHLPDRRQAAGRPPDVPPAQVGTGSSKHGSSKHGAHARVRGEAARAAAGSGCCGPGRRPVAGPAPVREGRTEPGQPRPAVCPPRAGATGQWKIWPTLFQRSTPQPIWLNLASMCLPRKVPVTVAVCLPATIIGHSWCALVVANGSFALSS